MFVTLTTLLPLSYLAIAVVDDLCFRKFHNWLFIALTLVGVIYVSFFAELTAMQALGGFVVGGALMLPLVIMGAIGAGDMKFMMCFGILMGTLKIFEIFVYALFWGALIGVLQSMLAGKLPELLANMKIMMHKLKPSKTQKIPYTIAIMMAWFSHRFFGGLL